MDTRRTFLAFISVTLLFTLFSFFTACSSEGSEEIVLTWPSIWVGQDSKSDVMEEIVAEFNEMHEGSIRVVVEPQPDYDGYEDTIRTRLASGEAPDIFTFKLSPTTAAYYESDLLMDFTDELDDGWGDAFNEGNLQASTIDGHTRSLPYEIGFTPIWYNQDLFDEAGIERFPETMEEFWDAAERLKEIDVVPTSQMTGGTNAWTSMLWYTHFVGSYGGPDVWERGLDDPAFEQAAVILERLFTDNNTTQDAIGADAGVSGGHYQAGRTAMFINGAWYIGNIRENAPEVYEATRLAPAPRAGDYHGHQVGWLHTNLAAANTDDPARRDAVVAFMQHLTSPENARRVSLESGSLLAIEFDIPSDEELDPLQQRFIEAGNEAAFLIDHLEASMPVDVVYEFGQAIGAMVLQDASAEEFVTMLREAQ